ncbi:MAG: DNA replication/repair protein RecF [Halioglobus sp.]
MALTRIKIDRVRNLRNVELPGLQQVNVFFGHNGSGKTSVLEAVHLLGMARSFRGQGFRSVISHGEDACVVFGVTRLPAIGTTITLGVQRSRSGEAQIRVAGKPVRTVAELAAQLPLQVINADSFGLLVGPPASRRQYLDWGVFHVEHTFFAQWQRFQRCIKQRNMLLRHGKLSEQEFEVWTQELVIAATAVNDHRKAYFDRLVPRFMDVMARLAPSIQGLELRFRQGWDSKSSYRDALEQSKAVDLDQGYTHAGPQRADIRVTVGGHSAGETLSRGQQKLVVCGLKLAQGQLMSELGVGTCTYLIDDLPSELDRVHSQQVCALLASMEAQVFVTCVEQDEIRSVWPESEALAMFHVEHGVIQPALTPNNTNIGPSNMPE